MIQKKTRAASLKPGTRIVINYGAYHPTVRATILGHDVTRWGVETIVRIDSGDDVGVRTAIGDYSTERGVGWKLDDLSDPFDTERAALPLLSITE